MIDLGGGRGGNHKPDRWNEMLLGAMPNEIAKESRDQINRDKKAQAGFIKEKIESAQDRLRFDLEKQGYSTKNRNNFKYETEKK